jgi:hypothetical protein
MPNRYAKSRVLLVVLGMILITDGCSQIAARRKPESDVALPASGGDFLRALLTMQCDVTRVPASPADSTRATACAAGAKDTTTRDRGAIGLPPRRVP